MVKKTAKFSVHSGNTLKAFNSNHAKQYRKQSFIVRQYALDNSAKVKQKDLDKKLFEWDVCENNVTYSLNKKGRWKLPSLIKECIHSDESSKELKLSLLERHKINRKKANCIGYHASKGETTSITPKKSYFEESSIGTKHDKSKHRRKTRRKRAKGNSDYDESDTESTEPQIIYQVYYPSSQKSSITHNPKYMDCKNDSPEDGPAKRSKNRRVRQTTRSLLEIYEDIMSAEEYSEPEEDSDDDNSADSELCPQEVYRSSQTLGDLLDREKELYKIEETYVHIFPETFAPVTETCVDDVDLADMSSWVYVDEDLSADCYTKTKHTTTGEKQSDVPVVQGEQSVHDHQTLPTAHILISSEDVKPNNLTKQFGDKYLEAGCHPRKFGIDLTEEITEICKKRKLISFIQQPWSWVVFTHEGVDDHDRHVFRVELNSELGFNHHDRVTLCQMNEYTVKEICQCVTMFVESCSPDSIQKLPTIMRTTTSRPVLTFDLLKWLKGWDRETYHSSQSHRRTLTNSEQKCAEVKEASVPVKNSPEFCNICFTEFDNSLDVHHSNPATSLLSCEHRFCESCWREHLQSTIYRGLLSLQCPEFHCKTEVDHMTALSLMQASEYKKFLQHCHDNKIQSEAETYKWCPNPKCGRILKAVSRDWAATDRGMCVTCDCGLSVCFDCLGEAHWPASCQQAKDHKRKLIDQGHDRVNLLFYMLDVDLSFSVRVKYCPKCGEAIIKEGGCRHMDCRCGLSFCWLCLTPIKNHPTSCVNSGKSDTHGTVRMVIPHVGILDNRPKFYSMAVRHRYYRRTRMMKTFRKNEKVLKASLKTWYKHQFSLSNDPSLSVCDIVAGDPASISYVVNDFISQIADLALEIHFVIENTAIVLQDGNLGENAPIVENIIESMELIVSRINKIFDCRGHPDLPNIPRRLKELQTSAKSCLISLNSSLADSNVQEDTWENKYIV